VVQEDVRDFVEERLMRDRRNRADSDLAFRSRVPLRVPVEVVERDARDAKRG
jgi:hypothetical protein